MSQPPSGTATPRSKLETLPREQLIAFVKKQVINTKKAQEKVTILEKQLADCQTSGGSSFPSEAEADEIEALQTNVKQLESEKEDLKREIETISAKEEFNLEKINGLTEDNLELNAKLRHESKELEAAHRDLRELRSVAESLVKEKRDLSEKLTAQFDYSAVKEECDKLVADLSQRSALIEEKEADLIKLRDELGQKDASLTEQLTNVSDLEKQLKESNDKLRDTESALKQAEEKAKSQIRSDVDDVEMKLTLLQEENQVLRSAVNQRAELCEQMQDENQQLLDELESYRSRMENERKILEESEVKCQQLEKQIDSLNTELIRNRDEWEQARQEAEYESELARTKLQNQIKVLEDENEALKSDEKPLKDNNDGWGDNNDDWGNDENDDKNNVAEDLEAVRKEKDEEILRLKANHQTEIDRLKQQIEQYSNRTGNYANPIDEMEELTKSAADIDAADPTADRQPNAMTTELSILQDKLIEREKELEALKKQVASKHGLLAPTTPGSSTPGFLAVGPQPSTATTSTTFGGGDESSSSVDLLTEQNRNEPAAAVPGDGHQQQQKDSEEKTELIEKLQEENSLLTGQLESVSSQMDVSISAGQAELSDIRSVSQSLQADVDRLNGEVTKLTAENDVLRSEKEALAEVQGKAESEAAEEVQKLHTELDRLQTDNSKLTEQMSQLTDKNDKLLSDCQSYEAELVNLTQENQNAHKLAQELSAKLADYKETTAAMEANLEVYQNKLQVAEEALATLESTASSKDSYETIASSGKIDKEIMTDPNEMLAAAEAKKSDSVESVKLENMQQTIDELNAKLLTKNEEVSSVLIERESLKQTIDKLQVQISSLDEEIEERKKLEETQQKLSKQLTEEAEQRKLELQKARQELTDYQTKLNKLKENESSQNVLNLEMEDYERSLAQQSEELNDMKILLESKTKENEAVLKEMDTLRSQRGKVDETTKKLKAVLLKTRKELEESKQALTDKDSELAVLQRKVEGTTSELDAIKVDLSQSVAGSESKVINLESMVASLQRQVASASSAKDSAASQLTDLQEEYDKYKTRVHTVLKQQSAKSEREEEWELERGKLEKSIDDLETKLNDAKMVLQTTQEELSGVQEENERLSGRIKEIQKQAESREKLLRSQIETNQTELAQQNVRHEELLGQMRKQTETQGQQNNERIDDLRREHDKRERHLEDRVDSLENELKALRQQAGGNSNSAHSGSPQTGGDDSLSDSEHVMSSSNERKPPMGMENPEPPVTLQRMHSRGQAHLRSPATMSSGMAAAHIHHRSQTRDTLESPPPFTPLEDLLNSDQISVSSPSIVGSDLTVGKGGVDMMMDQTELLEHRKLIVNLREVLAESEATNVKQSEQVKLLKEEIRRLERNTEREKHVTNSEYLKNVILKFLNPNPQLADERKQLIPVLQTMLRFSDEEMATLQSAAKGADEPVAEGGGGWSNYFNRWSGMT